MISSKHKALRQALREIFFHSFKQPCLGHKMRNILFNSRQVQREMKALVRQVFYASGCEEVIPERVLGEGKRRTTMVPHFPIESSGLRLLYASLINHSFKEPEEMRMTPDIRLELEVLPREASGQLGQSLGKDAIPAQNPGLPRPLRHWCARDFSENWKLVW